MEYIHNEFGQASKELHRSIVECQEQTQLASLKAQLLELNKKVQSLIADIPNYDRKRVIESVEALFKYMELKNIQLNGSNRFKFQGFPIPSTFMAEKETSKPIVSNATSSIQGDGTQLHTPGKGVASYNDLKNVKISLDNESTGHVLLTNVKSSAVICGQASSIHIKSGSTSVLDLVVNGPVFIHDLDRVILNVRCHQLRLHNVQNSVIQVAGLANNRVIIEDCNDLRIGALENHTEIEVDDFNWPTKAVKNPHYHLLNAPVSISWVNDLEYGEIGHSIEEIIPKTLEKTSSA
ncbi:uncharacterized protein RJT20DRAFT_57588 [Scheffersomyces xylosifermentans]|uniref:uncharacterized protein n=1 Tax=Scheffersomyces xylosifermentans TaxID=1304137 RepID=UPI00315CDEE1